MSWLELDDGILRHPKFIRAVRLAGSEAIHLWLGLRAYCGQLLTDGSIPADMVDVVDGPPRGKARAVALTALVQVGLVDETEGGLQMHDYLDWSSSRKDVEARRAATAERQRRQREKGATVTRESRVTHALVTRPSHASVTPSVTPTTPLPSPPIPSPPDPDPEIVTSPSARDGVSVREQGFAEFWAAYPRKVGRLAAEKAWKLRKPPLGKVLANIAWQRRSEAWTKESGKYIPMPATYLNQGRWDDEPMTRAPARAPRPPAAPVPTGDFFASKQREAEEALERQRVADAERFRRDQEHDTGGQAP